MNKIIRLTILTIFISMIYPPWNASNANGNTGPAGYYFILSNQPQKDWKYPSIDYGRLSLQVVSILFLSGLTIWSIKNKEKFKE